MRTEPLAPALGVDRSFHPALEDDGIGHQPVIDETPQGHPGQVHIGPVPGGLQIRFGRLGDAVREHFGDRHQLVHAVPIRDCQRAPTHRLQSLIA